MKAIVVSKRFNPGHLSHLEANANLLEEHGFGVKYAVHHRFERFSSKNMERRRASYSDHLRLNAGDLLIVWFPSLTAIVNMLIVRLFTRATIVYVYHEPYTSFASYRKAGFSTAKALKVVAISAVSKLLCGLSHKIILPSSRAFDALPVARTNSTRYAKINLVFSDEARSDQIHQPRLYISYIGTIAEDHAFVEFVHLVHTSISRQTLLSYKFLIATRSNIPESLSDIIRQGVLSGRLVVQSGQPMTNDQINEFYARSHVVWNAYKRSMQSGVLPKAYMFGTPVLMSACNHSEYFADGVYGAMLSDQYTYEEFEDAILKVQSNWHMFSRNCRTFYLKNFDHRALAGQFIKFASSPP